MSVFRRGKFDNKDLNVIIEALCYFTQHPRLEQPSEGIILTTPDGTKKYRVRIDNSGNVVTDLV